MSAGAQTGFSSLLLAVVFALSACAPNAEGGTESTARAGALRGQDLLLASTPTADIMGQWDVVSFEGYRPPRLSGTARAAYADFGRDGVALRMECNYTGRMGRVLNGRFVSEAAGDRIQTQIGCGPERGPREARYFRFFERSPSVEVVGADRLRLRAGQDELVLERPAVRRLSHLVSSDELQGEWEMLEVSWFPPAGGVAGIGLSGGANRIVIEGHELRIRGCPKADLTFRYTEEGRLRKDGGAILPAGPVACPGLSDSADGAALPRPSDAIRLLHRDPLVERTGEGGLFVSDGDYAVLLRRPPG